MSEIREYIIEFLKVIGDPTRLEIMDLLNEGDKSSAEIQDSLGKAQSTISQHLKNLTSSNLIKINKKLVTLTVDDPKNPGKTMDVKKEIKYYNINNQNFFILLSNIQSFVIEINKAKMKDVEDLDRRDTLLDLSK